MRSILVVTAAFLMSASTTTMAWDPSLPPLPDRSFLWKSEEAIGYVLPDELLGAGFPSESYGYDVDHYHLEITFDFDAREIDAAGTMTVTITQDGLTQLAVDLDDDLLVDAVTVDDMATSYTQTADQVLVDLEPPSDIGGQLDVRVEYHGQPENVGTGSTAKSMKWRVHGSDATPLVYTLSTPYSSSSQTVIPISHFWRPCKDVVDDKSSLSTTLTVPDTMRACSNGLETGNVDNGDGTRTFSWSHDYPVAPYLITVGATNYVVIEDTYNGPSGDTAIQHFVWPEDYEDALIDFDIAIPALTFFETVFGEYPFVGDKYGIFEVSYGPAVEEQTMVAYPNVLFQGNHTYDWIFVHELAHMWWGDAVTVQDWSHVWLHEGFASYAEALWFEELGGFEALRDYMLNMDDGPYDGTIVDPPYIWHSIVYEKGAWVLHMLRHIMGDEDFFQMFLDFRAAFEHGNAVTEDYIPIVETVYGGDLHWFFDPWLYEEGRPTYTYHWSWESTLHDHIVHLGVHQSQSTSFPIYTMPIDVRIMTTSGVEEFVIVDSLRSQVFDLVVSDEPISVELDPDRWILGNFNELTTSVEAPQIARRAFLGQSSPNPMDLETAIQFGLSQDGKVTLRVFDVSGRMIRTLVGERLPAGRHTVTWDGRNEAGETVPNGVYFYRLVGPDGVQERRVVVVR